MRKVSIIGCGSIGALKPGNVDDPGNHSPILTHAHAVHACEKTEFEILIDRDPKVAHIAAQKWGACGAIGWKVLHHGPDIVVVAVPTSEHYQMMKNLLTLDSGLPSLVIVEKPFCQTASQAIEIMEDYEKAGIPILVNYTRRFDTNFGRFAFDLRHRNLFGPVFHAQFRYGRGLKHDGCHALDLARWFFGEMRRVVYTGPKFTDHMDPSIGFVAEFDDCPNVAFVPIDHREYGLFEMSMYTRGGAYHFLGHGLEILYQRVEKEQTYSPGRYDVLSGEVESMGWDCTLPVALLHMMEHAVEIVETGREPLCTAADGLAVHRMIRRINESTGY